VTKPEPLPPIGLRVAEQRLGSNLLSWETNVEEDIEGYRLLRRREGADSDEVVAILESGVTSAEDQAVGAGERLAYAAVAFDVDGLESERSDVIAVTSVAYELSGQARDATVHLQWSAEVQEGFAEARILRLGIFGSKEIGRAPSAVFVDRDVKPGHRYRYLVILVREDGSEAPPSAEVEVEVPE
jgi:fibronectin type 3 domain-containing protein